MISRYFKNVLDKKYICTYIYVYIMKKGKFYDKMLMYTFICGTVFVWAIISMHKNARKHIYFDTEL